MHRLFGKGNTLVEVLIATLFISVGIVAALSIEISLNSTGNNVLQRRDALILAKSKLDQFKSYTVLTITAGQFAYDDIVSGSDTPTVGKTTYSRNWTVVTNSSPDYKNVDITVGWVDNDGTSRSITISAMISKTDPSKLKTVF